MFGLGCQSWFVSPVVANHFVTSSMKKFAILRTALLGLVRAYSQRANRVTEKRDSETLLPVVVFHIPVGIKHRKQLAIFLYLTSFLNISAGSIRASLCFLYLTT
jgi:hypothetical protein